MPLRAQPDRTRQPLAMSFHTETVQECVSEFISFITSEASDKCQQEKRKTINGDDLLWAMSTLGFDKYVEPLKLYLAKYREVSVPDVFLKGGEGRGGGSIDWWTYRDGGMCVCDCC